MYRKTIFISSVLFGLVFFGMTGKAFADAEADFEQAAAYKKDGDYQQAEAIYETIVTDYAGTKYALRAQRHLIYSLLGRKADLQEAIDKLVADFSAVAGFVPALYDVAGRCEERKQYEHAKRIYEKITEKFPEPSERAAMAQVHISKVAALPLIDSNDTAAAEAVTDKLINDFSGNPALPDAIYDIATKYETSNHFEHAKNLCRKVVADYPGTKYAFRAQRKLLRLYISVGPKSSIQGAVVQLVTDFSYYPDMARTLRDLAKKLERQGELEQAKSMYEIAHTIQGLRDQAKLTISYISAGDYDQASEAVDKLIADFADQHGLPAALYDIAGKYNGSGRFAQAKSVYQQIIQNHPDSPWASRAEFDAAKANVFSFIDAQDEPNALTALDTLITDFNNHPDLPAAINRIEAEYYSRIFLVEGLSLEDWMQPLIVWEKVMEKCPDFFYDDPDLYYFIACCYYKLGEYEVALMYFNEVAACWSDNRLGRDAQEMIMKTNQKLAK